MACSEDHKLIGVAVASGSTSVGARVPYIKPAIGVAATQAYTNVTYGVEGLKLLAKGASPEEALNKLLAKDPMRQKRQVAIMDFFGKKAFYTGSLVPECRGEIVGENYIVIGNLLKSSQVLVNMAVEFERSSVDLASGMVKALEAGINIGGDKRGEKSAALLIADFRNVLLNVRVDVHENPVQKLSHQLDVRRQSL